MLVSALEAEGYEVSTAATGSELMDKLAVSLHPEYGCVNVALVVADAALLGPNELRRLGDLADWARIPPFVLIVEGPAPTPVGWTDDLATLATVDRPVDVDHLRKVARSLTASELTDWASLPANTVM